VIGTILFGWGAVAPPQPPSIPTPMHWVKKQYDQKVFAGLTAARM